MLVMSVLASDKKKEGKDGNTPLRHFVIEHSVMVKNFSMGPTWVHGTVVEILAGKYWKHHVDHMTVFCASE